MHNANGFDAAPQHGPRPLPLFLDILRSETAASPELRANALAGLAKYQVAPRSLSRPPRPVVASCEGATLRDFGGDGPPVVVVPSLINPPAVLDLAEDSSLLEWLATQGLRPLLVEWNHAPAPHAGPDVAGHVTDRLVPLLRAVGEPVLLVGYCLGGTMALAAAQLVPLRALALIAAPWHFDGFSEAARAEITGLWRQAQPACAALGLVPMEVLQAGFWRLDPRRVVRKYADFAALPDGPTADAFIALEDWANGGAPLTLAAGREMFEDLFGGNVTGEGRWMVGGKVINPDAIACPAVDFVSLSDRIVPAASSARLPDRRELTAGHVGMVVGRNARAQLWEPLTAFLRAH